MQYREERPLVQFLKYTGVCAIAVLLVFTLVYCYQLLLNSNGVGSESNPPKITKTAYFENTQYIEYVDLEGYTYQKTGELESQPVSMNSNYEGVREALKLDTSKVIERYETIKGNDKLIDPLSLGMKTDIPNTYIANVEMSQGYIGNLIADLEWTPIASFCDTSYCDYYLSNKDEMIRIVVSSNTFKLLEDITTIEQTVDNFFKK